MEYWFPVHATLVLKASYAFFLFGACFCLVGCLWYVRRHAMFKNFGGLLTSSGFYLTLGGALMCASIVIRIGGAEPVAAMERITNHTANILLPVGIISLVAGFALEGVEKQRRRKIIQEFDAKARER